MMIATQPSQFVKTAIPVVDNVSSKKYNHGKYFLRASDGATRTDGVVQDFYNNDYVIHDGFSDEAFEGTAKYSTTSRPDRYGLVQRYMTMHSMSLSASGIANSYVMSGYRSFTVNRIRDIQYNPDVPNSTFYNYPNFRFTQTQNAIYNNVGFKNDMLAWLQNRTGSPRPLTCAVKLLISWCKYGTMKRKRYAGLPVNDFNTFVMEGSIDGGSFEGTYYKIVDSYSIDYPNVAYFGPVYQTNNTPGVVDILTPTVLYNMATNVWEVGTFNDDTGWQPYPGGSNTSKAQAATHVPILLWPVVNRITNEAGDNLYGQFGGLDKHHGYFSCNTSNSPSGLGLAYLHSLYVYV